MYPDFLDHYVLGRVGEQPAVARAPRVVEFEPGRGERLDLAVVAREVDDVAGSALEDDAAVDDARRAAEREARDAERLHTRERRAVDLRLRGRPPRELHAHGVVVARTRARREAVARCDDGVVVLIARGAHLRRAGVRARARAAMRDERRSRRAT